MNKKKQWFWTILIIIYVGFIFQNSLTPAAESSRQSGRVLAIVLSVFRTIGLNGDMVTEHLVRKMAHFTEFSLFGLLLWNCLRVRMLPRKWWIVTHLWLAMMVPLMDETFQLFTEGRSGQISDVWLDISGVMFGSFCMICAWYLCKKLKKKRVGGDIKGSAVLQTRRNGKAERRD